MEYYVGDIFNGRKLVKRESHVYIVECLTCGKLSKVSSVGLKRDFCMCHGFEKRFSGRTYKNPPEHIEHIKEKYKNGITKEILEEFADALQRGG